MLRVRLLGDLAIEVDGNGVELPSSRRVHSLLGWLALDRRGENRRHHVQSIPCARAGSVNRARRLLDFMQARLAVGIG
jgi:hypothetical protein